ncbi:1,4-beta-N-acetylmuramidase [Filimonas lacunae]|nr:1,4-beta-N-acetylmuramidase [Filimonas lacunae]
MAAATLSCIAWWLIDLWTSEQGFEHYANFGIDIPKGYDMHGIDVSKYQGNIKWHDVKQMRVRDVRVGFAFIKATEGLWNTDRQFNRNWQNAREARMPRGAYHFFLPTKSGKGQAEHFISTVKLLPGDLPPVLDIEQLYGVKAEVMRREAKIWLKMVEDAYGVTPIIYTYVNFYQNYMGKEFDDYPLWVAHYMQPQRPRIARDWLFWQHNETGLVNGIRTRVDFNVFNGDSTDFRKLLVD